MFKFNRLPKRQLFIFIFLIFAGLWFFVSLPGDVRIIDNNQAQLELLTNWSQGNVVALIRHTDRCDRSDDPCLEAGKKEGITVNGKKKAQTIAQGIEKLLALNDIDIYNSPVKRTVQTANVIFKGKSIKQDWLRTDCKHNFLNKIINHKHHGKNMILVTHATCMADMEQAGSRIIKNKIKNNQSYGIAYFFIINKKDQTAKMIGYINPEDWPLLSIIQKSVLIPASRKPALKRQKSQ